MKKVTPDEFNNILSQKSNEINNGLTSVLKICCEKVRSTALNDMAKTPRNNAVTYWSGKNRNIAHHPSLPGNPPAPDTGNMRASIHYTIEKFGEDSAVGVVGSDVDYAKMLEYGTSKVAPRPWLKPSLNKNEDWIIKAIRGVMKK